MSISVPTLISVRALALGGKFIGSHVNYANIEIYGPDNPSMPLACGLTDQGNPGAGDGSGITPLIMGQSYPWGYPIRSEQATAFNTTLFLDQPTILNFVATSMADPRISVSSRRWVVPGVALTDAMAVVMVIPGLLTELTAPTPGQTFTVNEQIAIKANVNMMCGCIIDNLFWPAANFTVQAVISYGGNTDTVTLGYIAASAFSGNYQFPTPGEYEISIIATEMNGNVGATIPVTITVNGG